MRANRPIATSIVPICYVRFTSAPTVPFAQIAVVAGRFGKRVKSTLCRHSLLVPVMEGVLPEAAVP
jgi:hypothetical protein